MKSYLKKFTNFSRAVATYSYCYRPEKEEQIENFFSPSTKQKFLARGNGLSYSDCCLFSEGNVIDTSRLNHFISFDPTTGVAICQGSVTFADLFLLDENYIPPILPGTLYATLAGGIANDVHGKNNPAKGNLGHHILWLELQINDQVIQCSPTKNKKLFYATIAGLGLTGVIRRVAIKLIPSSRMIEKQCKKFTTFKSLLDFMRAEGVKNDYQAAWLHLYDTEKSLLFLGNHSNKRSSAMVQQGYSLAKFPFRIINSFFIRQLNKMYFYLSSTKPKTIPLWEFNNPLDSIKNWNHIYGKKGLVQLQAVFEEKNAERHVQNILKHIKEKKGKPTLAVLKYFLKPGLGLLSFTQPGFTLAIDFINNEEARQTIGALNQYITEIGGKVYLAKDLFLNKEQFNTMYPNHTSFTHILKEYNSPMCSDLSKRLNLAGDNNA